MKTIKNERIVPTDIDGTLVIHGQRPEGCMTVKVYDPEAKKFVTLGVNLNMVKLVREEKYRGAFVIAWSRGGYEWAKNVINALELEEYVDLVMTKPMLYLDDTPVQNWLESRIFVDEHSIYKR